MRISDFTVVLLVCLLMCGCHRKDKTPTYYVDQEMLRYCWFPDGSYWIYEEANTPGLIDSVYLSNPLHSIDLPEGENFYSESFGYDLQLKGLKFRQGVQTASWHGVEGKSISYVSEFYSDSSGQVHDYLLFMEPDGGDTLSLNRMTRIVGRYDSLRIKGNNYREVYEVETGPLGVAEFTQNSLWAKDFGIVRRSLVNGEVWELVRYKIN